MDCVTLSPGIMVVTYGDVLPLLTDSKPPQDKPWIWIIIIFSQYLAQRLVGI